MGQVTLYLEDQTEERMRQAAAEAGLWPSHWIAELIRQRTTPIRQPAAADWPESVKNLAGAWPDFPSLEQIRSGPGEKRRRQ
jgi:hypothetical protein